MDQIDHAEHAEQKAISLNELAGLSGLPVRTVRYYIQRGLLDRPVGSGRGAYYTQRHLEQLLATRKWIDAGVSLDRIIELTSESDLPPVRRPQVGDVSVRSHIRVADGVELVIAPDEAGWTPEQVREVTRRVLALCKEINEPTGADDAQQ